MKNKIKLAVIFILISVLALSAMWMGIKKAGSGSFVNKGNEETFEAAEIIEEEKEKTKEETKDAKDTEKETEKEEVKTTKEYSEPEAVTKDEPLEEAPKVPEEANTADIPQAEFEKENEESFTSVCTVSVRCDAVLGSDDESAQHIVESLPEDGVILSETTVVLSGGESVFDVLEKTLKDKGIHLEFSKAPLFESVYIEGIANLYEFDLGELSGWVYSVNGEFPTFGCSEYIVKNGDKIEFLYTLDRGKDLGVKIN